MSLKEGYQAFYTRVDHYNQTMDMVLICMLLLRMITDAPAAKKLRDNESHESLKEKEPPDWPPGILEDKDEVERQVTRAVDQLWAGPGPKPKVKYLLRITITSLMYPTPMCGPPPTKPEG